MSDLVDDVQPPIAAPTPSVPPESDAIVEHWYVETFHNLGLQTDLQNRFFAAKERLKALLAKE